MPATARPCQLDLAIKGDVQMKRLTLIFVVLVSACFIIYARAKWNSDSFALKVSLALVREAD